MSMIWNKVDGYRNEGEIKECKEAQLLQAIMPFLPEQKKMLGLLVDVLTHNLMNLIKFLSEKILLIFYY